MRSILRVKVKHVLRARISYLFCDIFEQYLKSAVLHYGFTEHTSTTCALYGSPHLYVHCAMYEVNTSALIGLTIAASNAADLVYRDTKKIGFSHSLYSLLFSPNYNISLHLSRSTKTYLRIVYIALFHAHETEQNNSIKLLRNLMDAEITSILHTGKKSC